MNKIKLLIILMILPAIGISQNILYIGKNDLGQDIAIDTRSNTIQAMNLEVRYFFDQYGKLRNTGDRIANIKATKNDTIVMFWMKISDFERSSSFTFINYAKQLVLGTFSNIKEGDIGAYTYRQLSYLPPQENSIKAYQNDYFIYSSGRLSWRLATNSGCKCTFQKIPKIGDYIEVPFNGTGIEIISEKVKTHGIVSISIDNVVKDTVDLYAPDSLRQENLSIFKIDNLDSKQHIAKIQVIGKSSQSSNYYFVMKGFNTTNTTKPIEKTILKDTIIYKTPVFRYNDGVKDWELSFE